MEKNRTEKSQNMASGIKFQNINFRKCNKCNTLKSIDEFPKDNHKKGGYRYYCRECQKKYYKTYYNKNKEKQKERVKEYYWNNLEKIKSYCQKNRKKRSIYANQYRKKNKEKLNLYRNQWRKENPEKRKMNDKNRRGLQNNAEGKITSTILKYLKRRAMGKCEYCGKIETNLEIDHIIPLSKGGTNKLNNLALVCKSCNSSKKDKDLIEWINLKKLNLKSEMFYKCQILQ